MAEWKNQARNPALGPYFITPKGLFQNGIAARIGASAVTIYVALCEQANRKNGNVVSISDRSLASDTGVSERTIREIRPNLCRERLVSFNREPGHSYTYTLFPVELAPRIPVKERPRQPKKPRALYAERRDVPPLKTASEVQQKPLHPSGNYCYFSPDQFADASGGIC
jgi:hypothetical protein